MTSDNSGETELTEEELYKLIPNPPEMPPSIMDKAGKIVKLTGQAIMYLPIFLIDVIIQILKVIYGMFKQIKDAIGVPPIPYPFTLIDDLVQLVPKVKKFILTAPPEIEDTVEQKLKKKFHYAAALSVPKPNLKQAASNAASSAKSSASSAASSAKSSVPSASSESSSSTTEESKAVEQTTPPPATSNIQETPSVPTVEPKAPIAPERKPQILTYMYISIAEDGDLSRKALDSVYKKIQSVISKFSPEIVNSNTNSMLIKFNSPVQHQDIDEQIEGCFDVSDDNGDGSYIVVEGVDKKRKKKGSFEWEMTLCVEIDSNLSEGECYNLNLNKLLVRTAIYDSEGNKTTDD